MRTAVVVGMVMLAASMMWPVKVHAGGWGRLVTGLVTRGAIRGAVQAGRTHSVPTQQMKMYGPDVLSVQGLVSCLKKAHELDQTSEEIDRKRTVLKSEIDALDESAKQIKMKELYLDRYDQISVDRYNTEIRSYNARVNVAKLEQQAFNRGVELHNSHVGTFNFECDNKKYYADDMEEARKQAGMM